MLVELTNVVQSVGNLWSKQAHSNIHVGICEKLIEIDLINK